MKKPNRVIAVSFAIALPGCHTVKGVGQDLQKAGAKIKDAAKK